MSKQRQQRVGDLIHRQLSELLKKEIHDPRLAMITLTAVVVSPNLKQAKVFYTLSENKDGKAVQLALNKASGHFQRLLAETTALRYIPKLQFAYDESIVRASKISSLIDEAFKNNCNNNDTK